MVNLAVVPAVVGYPVLRGLQRLVPRGVTGTAIAAGLAAAVLFTAEYALGGAAGLPLRTVAMVTLGVYPLIALVEGLITGLVVRGLLVLRADLVQVARG